MLVPSHRQGNADNWFTFLLAPAFFLLAALTAAAQEPAKKLSTPKRENPVKVEVVAGQIDANGQQTLTVTFTIHPDYIVFANPVGLEDLELSAARVMVTGKKPLKK